MKVCVEPVRRRQNQGWGVSFPCPSFSWFWGFPWLILKKRMEHATQPEGQEITSLWRQSHAQEMHVRGRETTVS